MANFLKHLPSVLSRHSAPAKPSASDVEVWETLFASALWRRVTERQMAGDEGSADWAWLADHLSMWKRVGYISATAGHGAGQVTAELKDMNFEVQLREPEYDGPRLRLGTNADMAAERFVQGVQVLERQMGDVDFRFYVNGEVDFEVPDFPDIAELQ